MKRLRFSIGGLMLWVIIVAIDLAVGRFLVTIASTGDHLAELLFFGALPMANVLLFGLLGLRARRLAADEQRLFWRGFVICGAVAFLLFLACAALASGALIGAVRQILKPFEPRNGVMTPVAWLGLLCAPFLLVLPQLLLALIGGWFNRDFKLTMTRRSDLVPEPNAPRWLITRSLEWAEPKYRFLFRNLEWPAWPAPGKLNEPTSRSDAEPPPSPALPRNT